MLGSVLMVAVLSSSAPRAMQIPAAASRPELVLQTGQSTVSQVAFSADGRLIASGGFNDNAVHLWEVASGFQLRTLESTASSGDFGQLGVSAIAFGPANRLVAAGFMDGGAAVWEIATGRRVREFAAPSGDFATGMTFVGLDRDEKLLFGSTGETTRIWDLASGAERTSQASQTVCAAGLSPSGKELISLETSTRAARESARDMRKLMEQMMKGQSGGVMPGSFIAADLVLKDINSGRQTTRKTIPGAGAMRSSGTCAVTTTDGRILVPIVANDTIQLMDALAGGNPRILTSPDPLSGLSTSVSVSKDGRAVAFASGSAVTVWDVSRPAPAYVKRIDTGRASAAAGLEIKTDFSPDGRLMAIGTMDGVILICERATGRERRRFTGGVNIPFSVAFAQAGRRLFSGERTSWNLDSGRAERVSGGPFSIATAISEDGRTLAIGHMNGPEVEIWDASQKVRVSTLAAAGTSRVMAVGLSRDGKLAAVSYFATPQMKSPTDLLSGLGFDPAQLMGQMGQQPQAKGKGRSAAPVMPDRVALEKLQEQMMNMVMGMGKGSDGLGGQIKLFETATGKEVSTLAGPPLVAAVAQNLEFSPDAARLAVSYRFSPDPFVFDLASGQRATLGPTATPQPSQPGVPPSLQDLAADPRLGERFTGRISFSPDGRQMAVPIQNRKDGNTAQGRARASGSGQPNRSAASGGPAVTGGPIEIWDIASGRKVSELSGHPDGTLHAVYSSDGKTLVTSSSDNDITLWDVGTGREIRKIGRASSTINALALSPDSTLLATGGFDGATRLWDATKGEQVATLLSVNDGGDWLVVTPDGLFDGSPAAWNKILWRFSQNTFDVAPVEVFFNEYYYPDLLADLLSGKRPRAAVDVAQKDRRQAEVTLELPGIDAGREVSTRDVKVRVNVTKAPAGARDLRLFRNGSLVKIWHGDATTVGSFEATVPIVAGDNRFTAYVFNKDNVKSTDASANVVGAASVSRKGVAHVLAVGIDEYANPDYNLRYAVADARSFSADVKTQLEQLNRFERVNVTLVTNTDATKANIVKAITDLSARAQPEDDVLVFIASHGTAAADRFYVIPSDLGYMGKRTELDEKSVETILAHSISDQDLERAFEPMNAGRLLLVIDACNSGQALEAEEKRRGPMNSKGLAQLAYEKGMYVLTASQSFQAAQEVSQLGHGLLTYALVREGLDKGAADSAPKDGRVIAREWLDYATDRVPRIQIEKMDEARKLGRSLRFAAMPRGDSDAAAAQHPRVFYRRELDDAVWIVATPRFP